MTHVESVAAALADEPHPPNVLVSVAPTPAGETKVRLHTASPYHQTEFIVDPGEQNVEGVYLAHLSRHCRALANLGGGGAR